MPVQVPCAFLFNTQKNIFVLKLGYKFEEQQKLTNTMASV